MMLALLVGGMLAPVAMGLSLAVFPIGGAILVYALASGIFAFWHPDESWEWGLRIALGFLVASLIVLTGVLVFTDTSLEMGSGSGFIKATLIFGLGPAVVGGCLGGMSGSMLAHKRYKRAGIALLALIVAAGSLPFVG